MVRIGMCSDKRIGSQFLFSGLGYGGSCFPKDIKALIKTAQDHDCDCSLIKSADEINQKQRKLFLEMTCQKMLYFLFAIQKILKV